ncbi:hypothetical protein V6Z93_010326 [Aspergillus fumigatus]
MSNKRTKRTKPTANADHITSSVRVRENQRRSRARRKEYIRDLELRVRRFESLGVEATLEIQAAGRKVATENALLWKLLRHHGVTQEEILEYIKAHAVGYPPCNQYSTPSPTTRGDHLWRLGVSQPTPCLPEGNSSLQQMTVRKVALPPLSDSLAKRQGDLLRDQSSSVEQPTAQGITLPGASKIEQLNEGQYTGQSTPCETAARIIMTMRGSPDIREVRSELGCHSESNCMVRNMDIFEVLDK